MRWTFLILVILVAVWPANAYAYLDPATGGMVLQIVFGGIAIVLVGVKLFWNYLKSMFFGIIQLPRRRKTRNSENSETDI